MYKLTLSAVLALSTIFVIGSTIYFTKYIEHQKDVIAALDGRVKTLEAKVFPPKPAPKTTESKPKKTTRKSQK